MKFNVISNLKAKFFILIFLLILIFIPSFISFPLNRVVVFFLTAKDKVALLIGNMNYWEHPKLKAPLVDVYELTNLLRQLDFKVVSLLDLTEYEMCNAVDEFLLLLDKGVYGKIFLIFIFIIVCHYYYTC